MTHPNKLPRLLAIFEAAFVVAAKSGMIAAAQEPVHLRAHDHPAHSLLICGSAYFNRAVAFGKFDAIKPLVQNILLSKQSAPDAYRQRESDAMDLALCRLLRAACRRSMEQGGCLAESITRSAMQVVRQ